MLLVDECKEQDVFRISNKSTDELQQIDDTKPQNAKQRQPLIFGAESR